MKPQFNKQEFAKLNSILFNRKPSATLQIHEQPQIRECDQNREPASTNTNLHQQMQTLKKEVQTMLEANQNQAVEKVVRSTTRHYLQRIKHLSVELPESLEGFKEAAQTFLESLPIRRRPLMGTQRCISTERRLGFKLLFKALAPKIHKIYSQSFTRTKKLVYRRNKTNINVFITQSQKRTLVKYFNSWKYLLKSTALQGQYDTISQSLANTIGMAEALFFQEKVVTKLQRMLSKQSLCEVFIVRGNKLRTYIEASSRQQASQQEDVFEEEGNLSEVTVTKHEIQLKQSLTKMCVIKRQIIQTNCPNSDLDFGAIDLPVSMAGGPRHPLMIIPIVSNGCVIALVRCFWYPLPPHKFQFPSKMIQFIGTTLQTCIRLVQTLEDYREIKLQQHKQTNLRFLRLLQLMESSDSVELRKVFDELVKILECQSLIVVNSTAQEPEIVYSSNTLTKEEDTITRFQKQKDRVDNIYPVTSSGKVVGLVEIVKPSIKVHNLENLFRLIFQRIDNLNIKKLEEENIRRVMQKQQSAAKRLKIQKIMRIGFSELTSFSLLNISKVIQLLIPELNLKAADIFIGVQNGFVSGINYLENTASILPSQLRERLTANSEKVHQVIGHYGYVQSSVGADDIELHNAFIDQEVQLIVSFGVSKSSKGDGLVTSILPTFTKWVTHLVRISNVQEVAFLRKVNKQFKNTTTFRNQNNSSKVILDIDSITKSLIERVGQYISAKPIELSADFMQKHKNIFQRLIEKGYYFHQTANRLLFKQQKGSNQSREGQKWSGDNQSITALRELGIKPVQGLYIHCTNIHSKGVLFVIENVNVSNPLLIYEEIERIIEFERVSSRREGYQSIQSQNKREQSVIRMFVNTNHAVRNSVKKMFELPPTPVNQPIIYLLHQHHKSVSNQVFRQILTAAKLHKHHRKLVYDNPNSLNKLFRSIVLCIQAQLRTPFQLLNKRQTQLNRISSGCRSMQNLINQVQAKLKNYFIHNLRVSRKPLNAGILALYVLVSKRLSLGITKIKSQGRALLNSDISLIQTFSFPPTFKLLKNTLMKSRQLSGCELLVQNKQQTHLICLNAQSNLEICQHRPFACYRVEHNGFNLVWKLRQSQILSFELKQYLETLSKIVYENVKTYQELIFPVFLRLNLTLKSFTDKSKSSYCRRWRNMVLHSNKLKQYHNIEKVYRFNNQIKTLSQNRERKMQELERIKEESEVAKQKFQNSEKVLEFEKGQIRKIGRYLGAYEIVNCVLELQKRLLKRNCCWGLWKMLGISDQMCSKSKRKQSRGSRREVKRLMMAKQGLKEICKLMHDKNKQLKSVGLKELIINYVKSKQLLQDSQEMAVPASPIDSKSYRQLINEQMDQMSYEDISRIKHIRMPTTNSIQSETSKFLIQQTRMQQTRYCSLNNTRRQQNSLSPVMPDLTKKSIHSKQNYQLVQNNDYKQNLSSDNYFNPIADIKTRMITNMGLSSLDEGSVDMKNQNLMRGYKLSEKTLKFLKRFGRRLNVTQIGMHGSRTGQQRNNRSLLDCRTSVLDESKQHLN